MNLKPVEKNEPVTILMVPYDRYSLFAKSIDQIYKETTHPFKLIVIEGNAPENVREELEKRKRKHKNIQIIYSAHTPRMAEALNLGLVHVRTKYAFLMHNSLLVTPGWLEGLLERTKVLGGVVCPYVSRTNGTPFTFLHALLATKELLEEMGLFDESVGTPFWGIDLQNRLKTKGVAMHRDPYTVLEYQAPAALKGMDKKLFKHQWDDPHAHQTVAYLKQKWGAAPEEARYLEWLAKKRSKTENKPVLVPSLSLKSSLDAKNNLKKLIQVLQKA